MEQKNQTTVMNVRDIKGRFIKGVPAPHKGRKCPRMSLSKMGEKNPRYGKAPWNKGKTGVYTKERILEMSYQRKGKFVGEQHPLWKGGLPQCKKCDSTLSSYIGIHCRECWKTEEGNRGEKSHLWRGGITPLYFKIRSCSQSKEWREKIFKRDNYTCQFCKIVGGKLHVDHIKPFALIIKEHALKTLEQATNCKELWDTNNGRVLCIPCHKGTPTYLSGTNKLLQLS